MAAEPDEALWRSAPTLAGRRVVLTALRPEHAEGWLLAADDDAVFTHTGRRPRDLDDAVDQVRVALSTPGRIPFAQLDAGTGRLLGTTSLYDVEPATLSLAIGHTWLARSAQRTGVNREAKLLLLTHAFDTLGAVRVVWHTDERNAQSRAAVLALGATQEGFLRKHRRRVDGTWRTTVQLSMTDDDWPAVRQRLTADLDRGDRGADAGDG